LPCNWSIEVSAVQKQREPLERLRAMFGGTIRSRPIHQWRASGKRALGVMLTLFVLMSPRRQGQIKEALRRKCGWPSRRS
jgi:hypothetical protein